MNDFANGDIVRITGTGHFYTGEYAVITHVGKPGGARLELRLRDKTIAYANDADVVKQPKPEIGDLVKVVCGGRWQAHEGNVISINPSGSINVDFDYDFERPVFNPLDLTIVEKVPALPVRIEGQPIKPNAIKRGDKISVVNVEENEIKRTTILEATVDKVIKKGFYGQHREFQTRTGAKIHSTELAPEGVVISLVSDIDKDVDFHALSLIKPNEIIGFPDEEGGVETNIAVKKEYGDSWTVLLGEKSPKSVETVGLVNILKKKNVTFSIIRSIPSEPEFPFEKNQNVKVSSGYSESMSRGDYKVVIPGKEISVIKSRGISASTHNVPNKWLTKD